MRPVENRKKEEIIKFNNETPRISQKRKLLDFTERRRRVMAALMRG